MNRQNLLDAMIILIRAGFRVDCESAATLLRHAVDYLYKQHEDS